MQALNPQLKGYFGVVDGWTGAHHSPFGAVPVALKGGGPRGIGMLSRLGAASKWPHLRIETAVSAALLLELSQAWKHCIRHVEGVTKPTIFPTSSLDRLCFFLSATPRESTIPSLFDGKVRLPSPNIPSSSTLNKLPPLPSLQMPRGSPAYAQAIHVTSRLRKTPRLVRGRLVL